ncbi:MAG: nuclear transport factor 2 family protein [Myxococcota bacterium]
MSEAENKKLVQRFWSAVYEERDYEAVGRFFHDDGVYEDVPIPEGSGVGPAGIARRLALGHEPVEAFEHELIRMLAEGDTVITEHVETWKFHTGEVIPLPFCSVHVVRDGKFSLWRDYSNMATVLENAPAWWLEHIAKAKPEDFRS